MRFMPLVALLLLAACGRADLYTNLTETQANEMVALLRQAGIEATKAPGAEGSWKVEAPDDDFAGAIQTLHAQGYPREEFESLGSVFRKEGFVSSQLEERARLVHGLSQELSQTISDIDGVVQARVHIAIPEPNPLTQQAAPASAAVMLRYRPGIDLERQTGQIKALVVNSVEGLDVDNVTVAMFAAKPLPAIAPPPGQTTVASLATVGLLGLGTVGLVAGWSLLRERLFRRRGKPPVPLDRDSLP